MDFATTLSWGYFIVIVGFFWQKQEQQGGDTAPEEDSSQCSPSPEWRGHQQHVRGRLGRGPRWRRLCVPAFYTHQTVHRVWREHTYPRGMKSQSVWKKCSKIFNANIPNQKTSQRKLQQWYVIDDMQEKVITVKAVMMSPAIFSLKSIFLSNFWMPIFLFFNCLPPQGDLEEISSVSVTE